MEHESRTQLDELAGRLDDLRAGRAAAELAELVLLADGFTAVLLREVASARGRPGDDLAGTGIGDGP